MATTDGPEPLANQTSLGKSGADPASLKSTSAPLHSAEDFEAYCRQVQHRLAAHARQRSHFLKGAHDRLARLLVTARAVEDTALLQELAAHRMTVRELLQALEQLPIDENGDCAEAASPPTVSAPRPAPAPVPPVLPQAFAPTTAPSFSPPEPAVPASPAPRLPRRPMRPLADIEAEAQRLQAELAEWNKNWPLTNASGTIDVPNALRLRALACRQRRLKEESGETPPTAVNDLSAEILALMEAANDREYTLALEDQWDPGPTAWQWGELAERYIDMSRAWESFAWWHRHDGMLAVSDVQPLAEAVAAVQQRFNRLLFRIGARDPFQQQLFDELRTWAREAPCYLYSLRPKVPMAELVERAATLEEAWERARIGVAQEEYRLQMAASATASAEAEQDSPPEPEQDSSEHEYQPQPEESNGEASDPG